MFQKKCNIVLQFSRLTCKATLKHLVFLWTLRFLFFTLLVLALSAIQASWRGYNQYLRALNLLFVFPENISFLYIPGVVSIGIVGISWRVVMLSEKKIIWEQLEAIPVLKLKVSHVHSLMKQVNIYQKAEMSHWLFQKIRKPELNGMNELILYLYCQCLASRSLPMALLLP